MCITIKPIVISFKYIKTVSRQKRGWNFVVTTCKNIKVLKKHSKTYNKLIFNDSKFFFWIWTKDRCNFIKMFSTKIQLWKTSCMFFIKNCQKYVLYTYYYFDYFYKKLQLKSEVVLSNFIFNIIKINFCFINTNSVISTKFIYFLFTLVRSYVAI